MARYQAAREALKLFDERLDLAEEAGNAARRVLDEMAAPDSLTVEITTEFYFHDGFAEMAVVSFADLYGGKLVAALDRQHPRDLFDVRDLLRHEGINDNLRSAFAVYMIGHGRPMAEVLSARPKDIAQEFARGFDGMTDEIVTLAELETTRTDLVQQIVSAMPDKHRRLLISVEKGKPDWDLLGLPDVAALPAVQWRLQNLRSLSDERRDKNVAELEQVLPFA